MKQAEIKDMRVLLSKDCNHDNLVNVRRSLISGLNSHISLTKAIWGDHSIRIIEKPSVELIEISENEEVNLALVAKVKISLTDEVPLDAC